MSDDVLHGELEAAASHFGWPPIDARSWSANGWRVGVDPQGAAELLAFRDGQLARFADVDSLVRFVSPGHQPISAASSRRVPAWVVAVILGLVGVVAAFVVFTSVLGGDPASKQLIGQWDGTDSSGVAATIIFNDDGTAQYLTSEGLAVPAGNQISWTLDDGQDPMHLNLVFAAGTQAEVRAPAIVRFVDDDTIEVAISRDFLTRPTNFEPGPGLERYQLNRV